MTHCKLYLVLLLQLQSFMYRCILYKCIQTATMDKSETACKVYMVCIVYMV